jgi:hypothetical protein
MVTFSMFITKSVAQPTNCPLLSLPLSHLSYALSLPLDPEPMLSLIDLMILDQVMAVQTDMLLEIEAEIENETMTQETKWWMAHMASMITWRQIILMTITAEVEGVFTAITWLVTAAGVVEIVETRAVVMTVDAATDERSL